MQQNLICIQKTWETTEGSVLMYNLIYMHSICDSPVDKQAKVHRKSMSSVASFLGMFFSLLPSRNIMVKWRAFSVSIWKWNVFSGCPSVTHILVIEIFHESLGVIYDNSGLPWKDFITSGPNVQLDSLMFRFLFWGCSCQLFYYY